MKTGYIIEIYIDDNPMSPTYGEEREVRLYNTDECPVQGEPIWTEIYRYCEMLSTGAYTGYEITVFEDVNTESGSYGDRMEERNLNVTACPTDSTTPDWQPIGEGFCEQTAYYPSGKLGNNGYYITEMMDYNEYSATYQQIVQSRTQDTTHCPLPDTTPTWVIISETCHTVDDGAGHMVFDGTKDIVRYDANEYSPSYSFGVPETINVRDTETCPVGDEMPIWSETSYTCVLDSNGYRTGETEITEEDINPQSSTYGSTRTRTVTGDSRCPAETPQDALRINWRINNMRSSTTDNIQQMSVIFNDGLSIGTGGGIPPVNGYRTGTATIPYSKRNTQFRVQSITLTPNGSQPTAFTWTQQPNPYIQASQPNTTLVINLIDDEGTNPLWVEQSRTCELDGNGNNTGYANVVERDENPRSSTYNTTRTRRVMDTETCPVDETPDWVFVSSECQTVNGFNTGKLLTTLRDDNPYSPTYNQTRVMISDDTVTCPVSTTPNWVLQSRTCEKNSGGQNTGYVVDVMVDNNPNSQTYNQTQTNRYEDTTICALEPETTVTLKWKVINRRSSTTDTITRFYAVCNDGLTLDLNGSIAPGATVRASQPMYSSKIDTPFTITNITLSPNSSSPTQFGWVQSPSPFVWSASNGADVLTVELFDDGIPCWVEESWTCEQTSPMPDWQETSRTCQKDENQENTGYAIVVETDMNPDSSTYLDTRTRTVEDSVNCPPPDWQETSRTCQKDANQENTGYAIVVETDMNPDSPTYLETRTRTVEDSVNCPLPYEPVGYYKVQYTRYNDTDITKACDSYDYISQTLIDSDRNTITNATIGSCVTVINNFAFDSCPRLKTVIIPSNINQIKIRAFSQCPRLESVTCLRTTPPTIADGIFYSSTSNLTIYVPSESVNAYKAAAGWSTYASRIQAIPNS